MIEGLHHRVKIVILELLINIACSPVESGKNPAIVKRQLLSISERVT